MNQECPLGNFVSDAYKYILKTDIALIKGGRIPNISYDEQITEKEIKNISSSFNSSFTTNITGQEILDVLGYSVSKLNKTFFGFLQVS